MVGRAGLRSERARRGGLDKRPFQFGWQLLQEAGCNDKANAGVAGEAKPGGQHRNKSNPVALEINQPWSPGNVHQLTLASRARQA